MKLDEDIHNFYEHVVLEKLESLDIFMTKTDDYISDLMCLVLNQLPPRYIRHQVDMAFYLTASDRQQMDMSVLQAINLASQYLDSHPAILD